MCVRADQPHHPTYQLRDLLVLLDDVTHRLSQVPASLHRGEVMATISQHRQMVARWLSHPPSKTVQANAAATILSVIAKANAAAHAAHLDTGSWRPVQAELRAVQHAQPEAGDPLYFDLGEAQGRGIANAVLRGDLIPTPLDWLPRAGTKRMCEVTVAGVDEPFVLIAECVGIETPDGVLLAMEPAGDRQRERLTLLAEGRRVPARPPSRDELPTITETEIHGVIRRKLAASRAKPAGAAAIDDACTVDERSITARSPERSPSAAIERLLVDYIDEVSAETRISQVDVPAASPEPWRTPITMPPPGLDARPAIQPAPVPAFRRSIDVAELTWDDELPKTEPPPPLASAATPTVPPATVPPATVPPATVPPATVPPATVPPPPFVPIFSRPAPVTVPPPPSDPVITRLSPPQARPPLDTQELPDLLFANAPVGAFAHHSDVAHIEPVRAAGGAVAARANDRATPVPTVVSVDEAPPARRRWRAGAWLLAASVAVVLLAAPTQNPASPAVARSMAPTAEAVAENARRAVAQTEAEAMVTVKRTLVRKLRR